MDHPASVVKPTTPVWYGPEIEGHLAATRVNTAFLSDALFGDDLRTLLLRLKRTEVKHVFLTEKFEAWGFLEEFILPDAEGLPVTVGRDMTDPAAITKLKALPFYHRLTIIARANMEAPWVRELRGQDQLTVGVPYDLITWRVCDGVSTIPKDYEDDSVG